jgi:deoxyribonuclease V
MAEWPRSSDELIAAQISLGAVRTDAWLPPDGRVAIGGCFVCFERGTSGRGRAGERGWAAAAVVTDGRFVAGTSVVGEAAHPYQAGLLALREGPLLFAAV